MVLFHDFREFETAGYSLYSENPTKTKLVIKIQKSKGNRLSLRITNNKHSVSHYYKTTKINQDIERLKELFSLFLN
ncbi:unnamed protein product [Cryptosporidium hominis]|uniref:Signal recognition particle SRP9/SRP14 subunit n=1 Tax=Cryptosporidium hominis TaxID=237895 RepID=A0A0S4TI58_CRYHO|nr:Signal recognition particle SRP9/SRP14 subunit [Cryptosporidium hominis]CUV07053.1 unnamed protein product [Cryptosporidium hominis]|eukprot:PPS95997.1 Signal recognition particle SRP9/SRP14 subunit [Cryptosporidium hominis]